MKTFLLFVFLAPASLQICASELPRLSIDLNGEWQFEQTLQAFPPSVFTRTIEVPGLITLAEPRIDDYEKFFRRPEQSEAKSQHSLFNLDYTPRYSWYRKMIFIPENLHDRQVVFTLKKSQYVTQVYVNGRDMGSSMACYTPVEMLVTDAIRFGEENEICVRVGERIWLPAEAAGGTDKEKEHYLPGIWDDVELTFTDFLRVNRLLLLPSAAGKQLTAKIQVRNFRSAQVYYGDNMYDSARIRLVVREKISGSVVSSGTRDFNARRDNLTEIQVTLPMDDCQMWTPEQPFLYEAEATLLWRNRESDGVRKLFGMRDFYRNGKFFYLNGERYPLRGSNITLQRFFEDPDSRNLVWNKEWVKKMLIDYPKLLNWNMMRICVGIVPDFWYDLADEYGLLFQNEWLYWQNHGWNDQIRKEYTDWVWTDGSHPSIAIWDAINENWDEYIGNELIPELKLLDPTRVWDAGYMSGTDMVLDEMDEPHPYQGPWNQDPAVFEKNPYPLGDLDFRPGIIRDLEKSSAAQLINEYGWIWLWRDGQPSKLTGEVFDYYLGGQSSATANRELQAYWLQLETEWLRSNASVAGVLAFCYLANNYGYTGDWFYGDIAKLEPGLTLHWFRHCFSPAAVFINLADGRYTRHVPAHAPGEDLSLRLCGVNDHNIPVSGKITLKLYDSKGNARVMKSMDCVLRPSGKTEIPVCIDLPEIAGGYLLVAEFDSDNSARSVVSRRYLKVGNISEYRYFELPPEDFLQVNGL